MSGNNPSLSNVDVGADDGTNSGNIETTTVDLKITGNFNSGIGSFYVAESGVEDAKSRLKSKVLFL